MLAVLKFSTGCMVCINYFGILVSKGGSALSVLTPLYLAPPHELTEEEKLQILHSEEFMDFFDHSTRIIERALSEHVDVFFDYSGRDLEDKEG